MRHIRLLLILASVAGLSGCLGGMQQSSATSPTVSYTYSDDDDADDVAETAAEYCGQNYGRGAVLLGQSIQGDRYEATYSCQ